MTIVLIILLSIKCWGYETGLQIAMAFDIKSDVTYHHEEKIIYLRDSTEQKEFRPQPLNDCTPRQHFRCIYITMKETFQDGKQGLATDHWWKMSYIGRACETKYGRKKAVVFESFFALPHYLGMALVNGSGYLVYFRNKVRNKVMPFLDQIDQPLRKRKIRQMNPEK